MDALEAILGRRSIRKFSTDPVTDEQLETILRAAMSSPTAMNEQPWRFVVVRDQSVRDRLSLASRWAGMIAQAPIAIVVCADETAERTPDSYWPQECGAATQSILVAAHALGLGAVWVGVHPFVDRVTAVSEALRLPAHIHPQAQIAIGHPAEEKPAIDRLDWSKVHFDSWS